MTGALSRRVSVKDVARVADVSVGTVSNFLNDTKNISPEARRRIEIAIEVLGYRRNRVASSLRTSRTQTLGMIVPSIANPFYTSVFEGAENAARSHGYTLSLGVTHYDESTLLQYIDSFRSRQVDGMIINGYNTSYGAEALVGFEGPVIVVEPPANCTFSSIEIDNFGAARDAVRYLLGKGHTRIAVVPSSPADPRFNGYKTALAEAGIDYDPDLVLHYGGGRALASQTTDQQGLIKRGEAVMHELLDRTAFTACFFTLDIFAAGALKALRDRGIAVPEQVAVIGFDDIPLASYLSPSLTTVGQPHHEMGDTAVQTLIAQLKGETGRGPLRICLNHRLQIRASA
jgi:DNA-binding LacI/PurR family transcriptional regulator